MILDPAQFGCSSKLPFRETLELSGSRALPSSSGDYSVSRQYGPYAHSIDKVFRCSADWTTYASIALNHALGDIYVSQAIPHHVMFGFQFGPDATVNDREQASKAFFDAAQARSLQVGKCHSNLSLEPTSVTIAVCGSDLPPAAAPPTAGLIFLSRPLGAFKMHFLHEMGVSTCSAATSAIVHSQPMNFFGAVPWGALSDVSGDGLAGALLASTTRLGLDADVALNARSLFASEVHSVDVGCLENPEEAYEGLPIEITSAEAWLIARVKETAGPFIGFANHPDIVAEELERQGAIAIGTFKEGTGKVRIGWGD